LVRVILVDDVEETDEERRRNRVGLLLNKCENLMRLDVSSAFLVDLQEANPNLL
jgi:hypothetical protein